MERLKPVYRLMLVIPHVQKNETNSGVLLPEDFYPNEVRYIEATVVYIAEDCSSQFRHLKYENIGNNKVVLDRSMLQEINLKEKTHYLILENYILGTYRRPN